MLVNSNATKPHINTIKREQCGHIGVCHYSDFIIFIMCATASQITGILIVYSTICSCADQRKHQSSGSLDSRGGITVEPHKGPVSRKMFPFHDVIMYCISRWNCGLNFRHWSVNERKTVDQNYIDHHLVLIKYFLLRLALFDNRICYVWFMLALKGTLQLVLPIRSCTTTLSSVGFCIISFGLRGIDHTQSM